MCGLAWLAKINTIFTDESNPEKSASHSNTHCKKQEAETSMALQPNA
jgi:hypothetical protein